MPVNFLPRGPYTPAGRKGLGQDVSSADEIGIALVIAGDTGNHLCLAVAPTFQSSGGGPRIDANWQDTVLKCQTFDPLSHPPIGPRGGGDAKVLASALRFASFQSVQVFKADGRKARPRQLFDGMVNVVVAGDARAACLCFPVDGDAPAPRFAANPCQSPARRWWQLQHVPVWLNHGDSQKHSG